MTDIVTKFKSISNKIIKYDAVSIINRCIIYFSEEIDFKNPSEWIKKFLPWELLLLIRWVYQYSITKYSAEKISDKELHWFIKSIRELEQEIFEANNKKSSDAHFKTRMFYQLPFQSFDVDVRASIKRQKILFSENKELNEEFNAVTGISVEEFLDIYTLIYEISLPEYLYKYSDTLSGKFSKDQIDKFFCVTSLDFSKARTYIRGHTLNYRCEENIDYQVNEHSPLERYPFFEDEGDYKPYSLELMKSSLQTNIYDILKNNKKNKENKENSSPDNFGIVFQNYIAKGLEYYEADFFKEDDIRKNLPKRSKCIDFLVKEQNCLILIEAKSTELNPVARVFQSQESLLKNMDTIINGMIQVITTAYHWKEKHKDDKKIYGIIITYKNHLIGNSKKFIENIIGHELESRLKKSDIKNYISTENWFFISIDEFDLLIGGAKEKKILIGDIFENFTKELPTLMFKQILFNVFDKQYPLPAYLV